MPIGTPSVLAAGQQPAISGGLRGVLDQPIAPQFLDEEITSLVRSGWVAWEDTRGSLHVIPHQKVLPRVPDVYMRKAIRGGDRPRPVRHRSLGAEMAGRMEPAQR